jgi:hypothetical protein
MFLRTCSLAVNESLYRLVMGEDLDVRRSMHYNIIHKEISSKMQQCIKILFFHIYMKLNMFRALPCTFS